MFWQDITLNKTILIRLIRLIRSKSWGQIKNTENKMSNNVMPR